VTHDQIEAMTLADRVVVMSRAEIQQIGTPEVIYNEPANLFVAGFIGSPSMNLIAGALRDGVFEAPGVSVPGFGTQSLPDVVLGVRAEDMAVTALAHAQIRAEVFSFELTGDSTLVMVRIGEQVVTARAGKDYRVGIGEPVGFALKAEQCHIFDGQTQNRLRLQAN